MYILILFKGNKSFILGKKWIVRNSDHYPYTPLDCSDGDPCFEFGEVVNVAMLTISPGPVF